MRYKYFRVKYPRGVTFVMKAKSKRTLEKRISSPNDAVVEELSRKSRTGLKR